MSEQRLRILGWLIPGLSVALSIGIVWKQFSALKEADARHGAALVQLGSAIETRGRADRLSQEKNYSAVFDSPAEQNTFLLDLKEKAYQDHVTITNWVSNTGVYGAPSGPTTADGKPESLDAVKGFTRIDCTLTMNGPYAGMRKLVGDIEDSNRLFNFSKVAWDRTNSGTSLEVVVSRYLAPTDRRKQQALPVQGSSSDKSTGANR